MQAFDVCLKILFQRLLSFFSDLIVKDGIANSLVEFAFTSDLKLIDIKIRRFDLSSIEDEMNIDNFESTRTGRMLYQFSKQGLKIDKSLLRYRQKAEKTNGKV